MKISWLDGILAAVIALGAVAAVRSGISHAALQAEHERLAAIAGHLRIDDPTQVYLRALPTDDPWEFAWRIYLPAKYRYTFEQPTSGGSSGTTAEATHAIVRARLREEQGSLLRFYQFPGSSSLSTVDSEVGRFMQGRREPLRVEQLGRDGQISFAPTESVRLLAVHLPDEWVREGKRQQPSVRAERWEAALLEIQLRPSKP